MKNRERFLSFPFFKASPFFKFTIFTLTFSLLVISECSWLKTAQNGHMVMKSSRMSKFHTHGRDVATKLLACLFDLALQMLNLQLCFRMVTQWIWDKCAVSTMVWAIDCVVMSSVMIIRVS